MYEYFYLTGKRRNFTGEIQGYQFTNGVHTVITQDAPLVERILCRYYGAKRSPLSPEELRKAAKAKKAEAVVEENKD